jgi:hypothetical protein
MALYLIGNYPMQTTAAPSKVASGTSIKTLMQIKPGATQSIKIVEWGFSGDASASATPGVVELIETDVAASSGTAYVANDFSKYDSDALNSGDPTTNMFSVGTNASCYSPGTEGSTTAVRNLAPAQLIAPTTQFLYQSPLGFRAIIQPAKFARIRVTFGATVNILCYMILES